MCTRIHRPAHPRARHCHANETGLARGRRLFISDWLRLFLFDRQVRNSNEISLYLYNLGMEMCMHICKILKFKFKACSVRIFFNCQLVGNCEAGPLCRKIIIPTAYLTTMHISLNSYLVSQYRYMLCQ